MSNKWKQKHHHTTDQHSPESTKFWIKPPPPHNKRHKVPIVYYLTRNGHLKHPHFIEMQSISSLRGEEWLRCTPGFLKGSYKNGFVWHDLPKNGFIYPTHNQVYILKGSKLFDVPGGDAQFDSKSDENVSYILKRSLSSGTLKSIIKFDFSVGNWFRRLKKEKSKLICRFWWLE
ncbi:hypothetical protein Lser_V15G25570 [Lactuca serriola]